MIKVVSTYFKNQQFSHTHEFIPIILFRPISIDVRRDFNVKRRNFEFMNNVTLNITSMDV